MATETIKDHVAERIPDGSSVEQQAQPAAKEIANVVTDQVAESSQAAGQAVRGATNSTNIPSTPPPIPTSNGSGVQHSNNNAASSKKAGAVDRLDQAFINDVDSKLNEIATQIEALGHCLAPWTVDANKKKSKEVFGKAEGQRKSVKAALTKALQNYTAIESQIATNQNYAEQIHQSAQTEARLRSLISGYEEKERSQEDRIRVLTKELDESREQLSNKAPGMDAEELLKKLEGANPSKRPFNLDEKRKAEAVQERISGLMDDYNQLKEENDRLSKSKNELSRKVRDLEAKVQDESQIRDREVRRLNGEIKNAEEARVEEVNALKAELTAVSQSRNKDIKGWQRRIDASKAEADSYRAREKTLRTQLDEANAQLAKAVEDGRTFGRKASDARCARDDALKDLGIVTKEYSMLGAEHQKLVKEVGTNAGFQALPVAEYFANKSTATFPHRVYTSRGGKVLHNTGCGLGIDVLKMEPREYQDHKELQNMLVENGFVLCNLCSSVADF